MILATLRDLAKQLRCREDQAETVVSSEASARVALSRRALFQASGAVAAGSLFSFASPVEHAVLGLTGRRAGMSMLSTFDALMKQAYSQDIVFNALRTPPAFWQLIQKSQ